MSRFNNLEFGEPLHHEPSSEPGVVKDADFYLAEAQKHFRQGRFEQSLRSYSKVLEYAPKVSSAWVGQVRMLIELGEFSEACLWADKAIELFPNDHELLAAKASALARKGDLQGALAFSDVAMAQQGQTSYLWLSRGDVFLAREEKRAQFCFEKACALDPGDWLVPYLVSRIYSFYRRFALALKWAQQALAISASEALVWLQIGEAQAALGMIGPARNSLEQARQLAPDLAAPDRALSELAGNTMGARLAGWARRLFHR